MAIRLPPTSGSGVAIGGVYGLLRQLPPHHNRTDPAYHDDDCCRNYAIQGDGAHAYAQIKPERDRDPSHNGLSNPQPSRGKAHQLRQDSRSGKQNHLPDRNILGEYVERQPVTCC